MKAVHFGKSRIGLAVTLSASLCVSIGLAETLGGKAVDDLAGLRPDTEGVETNKFWDTRSHLTYTVAVDAGVSTNMIDTSVLTLAASNPGDIGRPGGLMLIVR